MVAYLTGLLEKCIVIIQGVKQAILAQMRYGCLTFVPLTSVLYLLSTSLEICN